MKKIIIILLIIIFATATFIITSNVMKQKRISSLKQSDISKQKSYEFQYKKSTYAISNIDNSSTNSLGIFLKQDNKYYLIKQIDKCSYGDNSFYIKDNNVYIYCISNQNKILKYELNEANYTETSFLLNLKDTPNISPLHLQFNKIDDKYIYLYSLVKIDDSIDEGNQIKCSLDNYKCQYDNGYTSYNSKLDFSYKLIYKEQSPSNKNDDKYTVYIYQNKNKVNIIIESNTDFGKMEYDVKSNKQLSKEDIKIEWTTLDGKLYTSESQEIKSVSIDILDKNNQYTDYSDRLINLKTKEVSILDNNIIK